LVSCHDERREAETTTALHHLRASIDEYHLFGDVGGRFLLFPPVLFVVILLGIFG
jgi:hypothetical protein